MIFSRDVLDLVKYKLRLHQRYRFERISYYSSNQ